MKTDDIRKLIEAFYNGNTNADDEQKLSLYFKSEDVDDNLLEEKELFLQMYEVESIDVPSSLELKLNNLIDDLAKKSETRQEEPILQKNKRRLWLWAGSAAAGIVLLISIGISMYQNKPKAVDTPPTVTASAEDQQKIKEAQEALLLLSANFNKGMEQLNIVSENLDKTNDILNRTFKRKNEKES